MCLIIKTIRNKEVQKHHDFVRHQKEAMNTKRLNKTRFKAYTNPQLPADFQIMLKSWKKLFGE